MIANLTGKFNLMHSIKSAQTQMPNWPFTIFYKACKAERNLHECAHLYVQHLWCMCYFPCDDQSQMQ